MSQVDPEKRRAYVRAYRARNRDRILEQDRARKRADGRPCLDCGAITDGSNGRDKAPLRCAKCTTAFNKIWTRDACIEAILTFHHRYGKPPSAEDWNPSMARSHGRGDIADRYYSDGDYPHVSTIQTLFGSWNAAIEAAGLQPRKIGGRGPQTKPIATHCKHGHPFDDENTYLDPSNPRRRVCRTCIRYRVETFRARRRAAS